MTFNKYNITNNAICQLYLPVTNTSNLFVLKWNYDRLPTSNFILKVTEYSWTTVIGRENILFSLRSWNIAIVSQRAYELVPLDDNASENIQQALSFSADSVCELVVSAEVITDIQNEVTRLEDEKVDKSVYNTERQVFSASTQWTDSYKITSSDIVSYTNWQTFKIQADVWNSDASTLELNSLWAKSIKKYKKHGAKTS